MKKLSYLLIFVLIFSCLFALGQIDDQLDTDSVKLLNFSKRSTESDAFYYLLGMYSNSHLSPVEVGRRQYMELSAANNEPGNTEKESPIANNLPLPEGELFDCRSWEAGCLESVFNKDEQRDLMLEQHKELISRAEAFHRYQEFATPEKMPEEELNLSYIYLAKAARLKTLQAISLHKTGKSGKAIRLLLGSISNLRNCLKLQDRWFGKIICRNYISEYLDVASIINTETDRFIAAEKIENLTQLERSSEGFMSREFLLHYATILKADKHPEIWEAGGDFPGWASRLVYKPNMTMNAITPYYTNIITAYKKEPNELVSIQKDLPIDEPIDYRLRNIVGSVLVKIAGDLRHIYFEDVVRVNNLDVKITLFNNLYSFAVPEDRIVNPYYPRKFSYRKGNKICFDGPLEDEELKCCLPTSYAG